MKHCFRIYLCLAVVFGLFFEAKAQLTGALPPIIVYKTTKDYSKNVAVTLSEDKTKIVAYPAPSDVSERSLPTALNKGYWLDNRGISPNTAFLSITYEEYAKLKKAPSSEELYGMIIDKKPIKKMYLCGRGGSYEGIVPVLNALIKKRFKGCERIK
ncbi:MAG: hypothetical protein FWH36_08805 [Lentimicrobiaceae bacterium]|nr:hypothetical protein [Lentimicrobiaceae bacterium]